jgi:hypothetical protein
MTDLRYLQGYPESVRDSALALLERGEAGAYVDRRYPEAHEVRSDAALYAYVQSLKARHLRTAPPLSRAGSSRPSARSASPGCSSRRLPRSCA